METDKIKDSALKRCFWYKVAIVLWLGYISFDLYMYFDVFKIKTLQYPKIL
jgi:hypothetical protein